MYHFHGDLWCFLYFLEIDSHWTGTEQHGNEKRYRLPFKSLWSLIFIFKEINICIHQGCIKFINSDSKAFIMLQKISVLNECHSIDPLIKEFWKNYQI